MNDNIENLVLLRCEIDEYFNANKKEIEQLQKMFGDNNKRE